MLVYASLGIGECLLRLGRYRDARHEILIALATVPRMADAENRAGALRRASALLALTKERH